MCFVKWGQITKNLVQGDLDEVTMQQDDLSTFIKRMFSVSDLLMKMIDIWKPGLHEN